MKHSTEKKSTKKNFVTKDTFELVFGIKWSSGPYKVKYGKSIRSDKTINGKQIF